MTNDEMKPEERRLHARQQECPPLSIVHTTRRDCETCSDLLTFEMPLEEEREKQYFWSGHHSLGIPWDQWCSSPQREQPWLWPGGL
jgi:hypothetical protein